MLSPIEKSSVTKKSAHATLLNVEPHVECFDIESSSHQRFTYPFQVITCIMLFFTLVALAYWMVKGDTSFMVVVIGMQCILLPFYFPGVYYYYRYFDQEKHTEMELDRKHELLKYSNLADNLLFHRSQIESCILYKSMAFPYEFAFLSLALKGGKSVCISNLIVEPDKIIDALGLQAEVKKRLINPFPKA